tara:strand:- start:134 stop:268 length:135 start_codon:yes stop_codon:yes gene_type:complete
MQNIKENQMKYLLPFLLLFTIPTFADDSSKDEEKKERASQGCGG